MKKLIIALTLVLFCISANSQERRLALVIGNANYPTGILANPGNDAMEMEILLKSSGFQVKRYTDLDQSAMKKAIDEFGKSLNPAKVGLFFYAGHGIQANGRNYLIPVDASLKTENDVEYNCVDAGRILARMEDAGTKTNIVILDACRDNPFERSWSRKSTGAGLAFMDAPNGSLIAYSTAPGKTASDGYDRNSPYTSSLIKYMSIPNLKIEDFFKLVRVNVREQTGGQQTPWESTSLEGDFYFNLDADYVSANATVEDIEPGIGDKLKELENIDPISQRMIDYQEHRKKLAASIRSIAVMPFSNYTGDESQAYIALGLQDALIGELGQLGSIRVTSKTSTLPYANFQKSMKDIASELNVDGIVEASLLGAGEKIKVHLKLYSAFPEEELLWSQSYDSDLKNIFNLYTEVSKNIADEIQLSLSPERKNELERTKVVNPEAYDAYLKAKFYWDQLTPDGLQKALEYFNLAMEKDPSWAFPYAGLAEYWVGAKQFGIVPSSFADTIIHKNINKALEMDPNSAYIHYVNALIAVWTEWNWEKGEREFLKVLEINPNDAYCRAYYTHLLMILRRTDEAYEQGKLSLELDPLNPLLQGLFGAVLLDREDYDEVISLAKKIPNHPMAIFLMEATYYAQGDHQNSIEALIQYLQFNLDKETIFDIQKTYEEKGYKAALENAVSAMEEKAQKSFVMPTDLAWIYHGELNKPEKTLEWLEKGFETNDPGMPYISTNVYQLDHIRDNPRFIELLKKMNLPLK